MGNKGRSNVKKPKQAKVKKPQEAPAAKKKQESEKGEALLIPTSKW